jgi:hypothetical protein
MAYKFSITIDYPQPKSRSEYRAWLEETIGSTAFGNLEILLMDDDNRDDGKRTRVDNGLNITSTNYYLKKARANDMHLAISTLLEPLGELLLLSDVETITVSEYNAIVTSIVS